jgi:hypothetical protein
MVLLYIISGTGETEQSVPPTLPQNQPKMSLHGFTSAKELNTAGVGNPSDPFRLYSIHTPTILLKHTSIIVAEKEGQQGQLVQNAISAG